MTAKEANLKMHWNNLPNDIRQNICSAVENACCYITLQYKITNDDYLSSLTALGYYIFFNRATNTHEIRW